jgi:hypothetical protein
MIFSFTFYRFLSNQTEESTSTVKGPIEVSSVTSGGPPSALAHIFAREKENEDSISRARLCLRQKNRKQERLEKEICELGFGNGLSLAQIK